MQIPGSTMYTIPGFQNVSGSRTHAGLFMDCQTNAIAQTVGIMLPVARAGYHVPCQSIAPLPRHTHTRRCDRRKLCSEHKVIDLPEHFTRFAKHCSPSDVRAIPTNSRPHVGHCRFTHPGRSVRGLVVGNHSIRSRGHYSPEVNAGSTELTHHGLHPESGVSLPHTFGYGGAHSLNSGI